MQYYPFDSRNRLYREKIGALAEGEALRLRLLLHDDARVHNAFMIIRRDGADTASEMLMKSGGRCESYRFYECEINLTEGLYWYSFRYTSDYGEFFVTKTDTSLGIVSAEGSSWQQTVFSKNFTTPEWLSGGIIYQIFPDRFFSSRTEKPDNLQDRYICTDWEKTPEHRQNGNLCRLGNDYYGGDFKGIEQKLDYIASLGVSCIYLNPIFEAHSNHRYNTADYSVPDPLLGTEEDFCSLIKKASEKGISIILDGVFSHTGDDSIYFNKYGRYDSVGAFQTKASPYYSWYNFSDFPDKYAAWWGIDTLPETNENDPSFSSFITNENGILRYWLKKGVKGWRLDVADELPDDFLDKIRLAVKSEGEENFILGEVWEDATNKISYGARRRFLRGRQLDSVMNYPFANAIISFVKGADAELLMNTVLDITENYPPQSVRLLMNHIGTHDTARVLTRLSSNEELAGDRERQAEYTLSAEEYEKGVRLLKLAAVLQYTLPGVPSLYYGDEVGMQGWEDPFCRAAYPWGKENRELLDFYRRLGKLRRGSLAFADGEFIPVACDGGLIAYMRKSETESVIIAVNRSTEPSELTLPCYAANAVTVWGNAVSDGRIILPPESFCILTYGKNQTLKTHPKI